MSQAPRIAVFGSVNMDLVAYAERAPAGGETVPGTAFSQVPGGKGANQAVAAARAGGDVVFLGAVGDDAFGTQLRTHLLDNGVDVTGLRTEPGTSGVAHIVVDGRGENSIVVVPGANGRVGGPREEDARLLEGSAALLLQLELPLPAVVAAARTGRELGVPVVLTPAPARELPAELLDLVDVTVPNQHEAAAVTGEEDPQRALAALLERVPEAVLTLGEGGALHGLRGQEPVHVPAMRASAVDTTGAGDTLCGTFAVARAQGRSPEAALRFATAAAALAVQRRGAGSSMPVRDEIEALLAG